MPIFGRRDDETGIALQRVLEQVPTKNLDTGENTTLLRHLDRSRSIDPITKDIGRRMSLKQHHSLRRDGSTPSGSVPSDDASSTHSFETDAISTMSSTSKIGHAFTAHVSVDFALP